ncbi:MAG: substrate-binding domain-containing protein [Collinsella sp.]
MPCWGRRITPPSSTASRLPCNFGESLPDENVIYTGWSSGDGYQATRRLLAREIHADGVLCGSDRIATGVIAAFNEAGISVPKTFRCGLR